MKKMSVCEMQNTNAGYSYICNACGHCAWTKTGMGWHLLWHPKEKRSWRYWR